MNKKEREVQQVLGLEREHMVEVPTKVTVTFTIDSCECFFIDAVNKEDAIQKVLKGIKDNTLNACIDISKDFLDNLDYMLASEFKEESMKVKVKHDISKVNVTIP